MAIALTTSLDDIVKRLGGSLHSDLQQAIEAELRNNADIIVRKAANDVANHLKNLIIKYDKDVMTGGVRVVINIDGVPHES